MDREGLIRRMREASQQQKAILQEIHNNIRKMEDAKKELRNRRSEMRQQADRLADLGRAQ